MEKPGPPPVAYESKDDFKRRRRFWVLTDGQREIVNLAVWMISLFVGGLVLGFLVWFIR